MTKKEFFMKKITNPLDEKNRTTDIVSLRQLLSSNYTYRVPDYQRGYAWNSEFVVMWQDIMRLHRTSNRKHYTGMLALEEITDESTKENEAVTGTTSFYIVDGQQRITSLVIIVRSLLSYIRDELPDKDLSCYEDLLVVNNVNRFGYSVKRQDGAAEFFERRVYNNNTGLTYADRYLSNIDSAKTFIEKELNRISGKDALELLKTILCRIVFNLYFVTEDFDVRIAFETINNRGKRLSKLELLKNRLMYLSTFFPQKDVLSQLLKIKINTAWKKIYENLCFGDDQLSDDDYLRAHWIVYKRFDKRKRDAYIDDLLNNEFSIDTGTFYEYVSNKKYREAFDLVDNYIASLSKYSLYWAFVNKPDDISINNIQHSELKWIKRLSRISGAVYLRATLMVVVAENNIVLADKENFYSKIEQFIFTNKLLAQDKNDLSFLISSAKDLLSAEQNQKAQYFQKLIACVDGHELKVDADRIVTAIDAFKLNVLEKKSNYYYDWNGLRYFLYEYNESLNIENAAQIEWYKLINTSIEHVLPQTPTKEYWKTAFQYNDEQMKLITNSLGNLLLLSCGAENSTLKNYSFPVKKDMSVESGKFAYKDGSRSARKIAEENYWTINEVSKRTDELIRFMFENWFENVPGMNKEKWQSCATVLQNKLPPMIDNSEYSELTAKLDAIDVSDERTSASNDVSTKKPDDYLQQQFLGYIDTETIPIKYNNKKIYYKNYYTFKIISNNNGPKRFECGVTLDDIAYRVRYSYETNEIDSNYWENGVEKYVIGLESLPKKFHPLVISLFRYLRKAYGKEEPVWCDRSN